MTTACVFIETPECDRGFAQSMLRPLLFTLLLAPAALHACPNLTPFYPGTDSDWAVVRQSLRTIFDQCLQSSEYFALLGASELNSGFGEDALDSLERALLLDPDNGAAQIDYAQALMSDGQLFAALALNEQILDRQDLPIDLAAQLERRQERWLALTRQQEWQLDVLTGYDDNLNGAPDTEFLTLTISGEPLLLPLGEDFQPVTGPFVNVRGVGRLRRLGPDRQHNFSAELRGRVSGAPQSDIVQLAARYALYRPDPERSWQLNANVNHLFFGGKPLFTGSDVSMRYQFNSETRCSPYVTGAAQHQIWHGQSQLNGVEAKAGVGNNCVIPGRVGLQRLTAETSLLGNYAASSNRLGGHRQGFQVGFNWQLQLDRGWLQAQFVHTQLTDGRGYSPLLANGARRKVERDILLLSYSEPVSVLGENASVVLNVYHQVQRSNLELFTTTNTTIELGYSWRF